MSSSSARVPRCWTTTPTMRISPRVILTDSHFRYGCGCVVGSSLRSSRGGRGPHPHPPVSDCLRRRILMPADLHTELHGVVAERLQGRGQRYTANRRALVEVLASANRPLTIQHLLDRADGLPQSSAYRNLTLLEDSG